VTTGKAFYFRWKSKGDSATLLKMLVRKDSLVIGCLVGRGKKRKTLGEKKELTGANVWLRKRNANISNSEAESRGKKS